MIETSPCPWERPLYRHSSERRLDGIDVFHDFIWEEVFRHNRSTFPRGQSLARTVRRESPEGKQPTLILTTLPLEAKTFETEDRFIAVVPIEEYLASKADPAATYFAQTSGTRVTGLLALRDSPISSEELQPFLTSHLTKSVLEEWMRLDPSRRQLVRELAGSEPLAGSEQTAQPASLADALRKVSQIDDATFEMWVL